jgi:hypothetical protein
MPPQQMPFVQYPQFPPYQAMPYQQYLQQGQPFVPVPTPQGQPMVAQPVQLGVANAVRPKRKKKKQPPAVPQGQAPPPQLIQPVLAPDVAVQASLQFPMGPLSVSSAQVTAPSLVPGSSNSFIQSSSAAVEKVKTPSRANAGNVLLILMLQNIARLSITVLCATMQLIPPSDAPR